MESHEFAPSKQILKITLMVFFDSNEVVHSEFIPPDATIKAASYCVTFKKLSKANGGRLNNGVVLLRDNTIAHLAHVIQELLQKFKYEVWYHLP
ncbi:hypothetical protein Trydic_g1543 [Trypoxylus dichotomus]